MRDSTYRRLTHEDKAVLRTLAAEGVPPAEIADLLGCDASTVKRYFFREGNPAAHRLPTDLMQDRLESLERMRKHWKRLPPDVRVRTEDEIQHLERLICASAEVPHA